MSCQTSSVWFTMKNWERAVMPFLIFLFPVGPSCFPPLLGSECGVGSWWAASGKPWCRVAAHLAHSWPSGWASDANLGSGCPYTYPFPSVQLMYYNKTKFFEKKKQNKIPTAFYMEIETPPKIRMEAQKATSSTTTLRKTRLEASRFLISRYITTLQPW